MIKNFNTDKIRDIILILNDRSSMIKTDIKKALDVNGGTWTFLTVFNYLNYMKSKDIVSFKKSGRVCNVCLTDKGKALVKSAMAMTAALK